MSSEYDDVEEWIGDGEDLADWDIEGTREYYENLEKSAKRVIDDSTLEKIELSMKAQEEKYQGKGYQIPYQFYPKQGQYYSIAQRLELVEKRLDALTRWLSEHGVKPSSTCPYEDQYKEKKSNLENEIATMLKDRYPAKWQGLNESQRRKWVEDTLIIGSVKAKESLGIIEKHVLDTGTSIIRDFDEAYRRKKCFACGWTDSTMSWSDFLQHMNRVHTSLADQFYWAIQSLEPARYHRMSKEEKSSTDVPKSLQHQKTLLKSRKELLEDQNS